MWIPCGHTTNPSVSRNLETTTRARTQATMASMSINILNSFLPKFAAILAAIPDSPDHESGTHLVKTFADLIATKLGAKDPATLVADHDTALVFEDGKEPSAKTCLLYTSPSPRDQRGSRMPSSA